MHRGKKNTEHVSRGRPQEPPGPQDSSFSTNEQPIPARTHMRPRPSWPRSINTTRGRSWHCSLISRWPPDARVSVTHRATNIGRVVDARWPFVSAVAVCGDKSVLLSISGAAIDLVFPAWLRGTFYPGAATRKRHYLHRKLLSCPGS